VGQGLDEIHIRKFPIPDIHQIDEMQYNSMFHAMCPEMLASEGFEKNLQQFLIQQSFFNSFPQLVHKC